MKNIKIALGLFFASSIPFSACGLPRSFFNKYPASTPFSAVANANEMLFRSCLSFGSLEGPALVDFIKKQRNLESNLNIVQLRYDVKMREVQRDIKIQFLKWEREQADQQKERGVLWIKNDALRNNLIQYRWQYFGGVVAVIACWYLYRWGKNKKTQEGKDKGII